MALLAVTVKDGEATECDEASYAALQSRYAAFLREGTRRLVSLAAIERSTCRLACLCVCYIASCTVVAVTSFMSLSASPPGSAPQARTDVLLAVECVMGPVGCANGVFILLSRASYGLSAVRAGALLASIVVHGLAVVYIIAYWLVTRTLLHPLLWCFISIVFALAVCIAVDVRQRLVSLPGR